MTPELQEPCAFTIEGFCKAHHVSRTSLYQMRKDGTGPRVMRVGSRLLISKEAAADWRRAREEAAAEPA